MGGASLHYTANYWRFHEIDFIERSVLGAIDGTGFADWPITYADLERYYTQVEWEFGVSGLAGASPFDPPRAKPYPMAPLPVKSSGMLLERGARKLGLHPFRRRWRSTRSLVDRYHRSHDIPNLFICDGSSLVTSGRGQPTMTIQALAFRAGDHIARFAKRGEI